ncbi:MAG TPA: AsmA family protein, partial [Verrucomicrobiae bacterium]
LLTASGSGSYSRTNASADAQVDLQTSLPGLGNAFPLPGANFSSGTVELNGRVTQKQSTQTVTGKLTLSDLTGQFGNNSFSKFGSTMDVDVSRTPEQIQIHKLDGGLTQAGTAGGNFNLTGSYDPVRQAAQLSTALSGFNQNGLRPFLEPLLAGKKLVSVAINGNASVQYDPNQSSAIKADLQVTNLVVHDPAGKIPATRLDAGLQIDTTLQKQSADIRQFQISLTPTKLAQNQIQLQGQVNFAQAKAIQGNLKLTADSLDLTSYFDLFAGGAKAGTTSSASAPATPAPAAAGGQEPPPITLPMQNFTVTANLARVYLREVAVTNFQTTVKLDTNRVTINPLQFSLNGAPVSAAGDVDLSVPGYKYNVALDASQVPFAPLVNSFAPDRKGELSGLLTAHAQIRGAGVINADWQKNLAGQFDIGATNLGLSVINAHSAILKSLINVVATIPQLLSNPEAAIISIFDRVTGRSGGLVDELQKAPIEIIAVRGQAGAGRVNVQQATVQSAAFSADAPGEFIWAPVLTNSTINFPITISVSQSIAKQLNLTAANSVAGTTYVALPQFLTMTGTRGNPQKQIKRSALVGLTLKSIGNSLLNRTSNTNTPVGELLDQLLQRVR